MRKTPEGYVSMSKVAKDLNTSSSTIIRLSHRIEPPLQTLGTYIREDEIKRIAEALPKHIHQVKLEARAIHIIDEMIQGSE